MGCKMYISYYNKASMAVMVESGGHLAIGHSIPVLFKDKNKA